MHFRQEESRMRFAELISDSVISLFSWHRWLYHMTWVYQILLTSLFLAGSAFSVQRRRGSERHRHREERPHSSDAHPQSLPLSSAGHLLDAHQRVSRLDETDRVTGKIWSLYLTDLAEYQPWATIFIWILFEKILFVKYWIFPNWNPNRTLFETF